LVEVSAALEAVQGQTLATSGVAVDWGKSINDIPQGPVIVIGNEFLDCLPIRQFVQFDPFAGINGWHERVVNLNEDENFRFEASPEPASQTAKSFIPEAQTEAKSGDLVESCPSVHQIIEHLKTRFEAFPGRALFIDYGPESTEFGDTLQALKRHKKIGVFDLPGESDLTARVDFETIYKISENLGLKAHGPIAQREFLSKLGLEMRAVALARAKPDSKPLIARQLHRLTDDHSGDDKASVEINRTRVAQALNTEDIISLSQIHSDQVKIITEKPVQPLQADGLVTTTKNLALSVLSADCGPVLLHDPFNEVIGACHAGWKGAPRQ